MLTSQTRGGFRLARPFSWLVAAALTTAALVGPTTVPVLGAEQVTLCHAAGQAGSPNFVTMTIGGNVVYGPAGHLNENGTPQAGHEQDYLGACGDDQTGDDQTGDDQTGDDQTGGGQTGDQTGGDQTCGYQTGDDQAGDDQAGDQTGGSQAGGTQSGTTNNSPASGDQPGGSQAGDAAPGATTDGPAPIGQVAGATGTPRITLPPTDTLPGTSEAPAPAGDGWRLILLAMAGILATTLLLTPTGSVARRRDR